MNELIKLSIETKEYETLFNILNFSELSATAIIALDEFAKLRGGGLKYRGEYFYLKKRWDKQYAQKVFEAKEMRVELTQIITKTFIDELPPHRQRISYGKYKGKKWTEIPMPYLKWLHQKLENSHQDCMIVKKTINYLNEK